MKEIDDSAKNRFIELMSRVSENNPLSDDEKTELFQISDSYGINYEASSSKNGIEEKRCYWICERSNWMCNPQSPPPNCRCVRRCI